MRVIKSYLKKVTLYVAVLALSLSTFGGVVEAKPDIAAGSVFKGRGHSTLYYLTDEGTRLVFPNQETYLSWYGDFDEVVEIDEEDLAEFPLRGNVRYKPGVFLVKIQSDSKVYAVGANGALRWVKTEELAKKLYGDNWNKLIDDVPVAFFVNYAIGEPIETDEDFDAQDEEEDVESIDENRRAKIKAKVRKKLAKRKERICDHLEKRLNRLQERLEKRGIDHTGVGDHFVDRCVDDDTTDDTDDSTDTDRPNKGKKIYICHVPPGHPEQAKTLSVGPLAARAHLSHGDTVGKCDDSSEDDNNEDTDDDDSSDDEDGNSDDDDSTDDSNDTADTTAPVISGLTVSAQDTTATVTWTTDEASDSELEYATESFDTATSTIEIEDETLVTDHSIELTELLPNTTYFFEVESRDEAGNKAEIEDQTFTTTE